MSSPAPPRPDAVDPRRIVRDGYDLASHAYRGDVVDLGARSGYAHWLRRLERHLAPGSRVLDLGCGNGLPVARELARRHRVTGLDLSEVQVARARVLVPEAGFVCGDMTAAGFAAGAFDAVVAFYSIVNVPVAEQPALFRSVAEWIAPGGWLLAVVGRLARTEIVNEFRGVAGARMFWSHGHWFEYRRWLAAAGFAIVEHGPQPARSPAGYMVALARRDPAPAHDSRATSARNAGP